MKNYQLFKCLLVALLSTALITGCSSFAPEAAPIVEDGRVRMAEIDAQGDPGRDRVGRIRAHLDAADREAQHIGLPLAQPV